MSRFCPGESGLTIAAVIATHNRADLLANRALASVAGQARRPDFLVVVDDSDARERRRNEEAVDALALPATKIVYLGNYRTPGASGAWNTALAWLLAAAPDCFVAVLDDDDAWESAYLARCEAAALAHDLDMAAAGLVFHKTATDAGMHLSPPESLNADDFLTGNPHIQGSNLFARLTTLLEAGGFDEGLRSTTDRDLCIRLADLGTVRYAALAGHPVHHYAEPNRRRLSTPGADAKRAGLTAFYRKHGARMTDEQRRMFVQRSRERFDCNPTSPPPAASPQTPSYPAPDSPGGRLVLLVGAITSPDVDKVARLMGDLIAHYLPRRDIDLRVLLLENGGADAAVRAALQGAVADAAGRGLAVQLIALEQQAADGADAVDRIRSIARSRTLLQRHLYRAARERPDAVVWIVDDDCRVDGDDAVDHLKRFRQAGGEIVLGVVTGAPPLPFLSCVRTQLVDLYHNLEHLARLRPDAPYPRRSGENAAARRRSRDYYYDLSRRETAHLESPFWYEPAGDGATVGAAFAEMVDALPGILNGVQVFRPLVVDGAALVDPVAGAWPSVNRGPTTYVFDPQALHDFPNAVPAMEGADLRRSDMVWCLLNHFVGGRQVVQAPLPVRQLREAADLDAGLDGDKLAADMRGYALYSCMRDVFERKAATRDSHPAHGPALLDFDRGDMVLALGRFRKYLHERMNAFALSYFRILGLLKSFDRYVNATGETGRADFWWLADEKHAAAADALRRFVAQARRIYAAFDIDDFRRRMEAGTDDLTRIREYLNALPRIIEQHRADCRLPARRLTQKAAAFIRREFATGELRRLGGGFEGIVLTDGKMVYKVFHGRGQRDGGAALAFLESQIGKWHDCATLYPILQVRRRGEDAALVYPFERGAPYAGGHLDGILRFLRECRAAGIVCNNVHPDNFIVVDGGLKLVDYGADIVPFTEDRFLHMCRRAFLMYRFHNWSGLRHIMRRALRDDDLPHLTGFAHFMRLLAPADEKAQLDRLLLDMTLAGAPATVFDYGCGKGKLAEAMAARGLQVTAYDIDNAVIRRCRSRASSVRYLDADAFSALGDAQDQTPARFDAVVCSLVLCCIENPREFDAVLADLRQLVAERGRVIVAVCNPFYTFAGAGESRRRHLPADAAYHSVFAYRKDMPATGRSRRDVHRPFHFYTQAFLRAGLVAKQARETQGTDARLWPASDFLVFDLRPAPVARARVSLLIKTCCMEWRAIEQLVRHKTRQLAVPGGFLETLVIVDSRRDGFLRQYDAADPAAHQAAMRRLLDDGVVDKVIHAPEDAATVAATYREWFGAAAAETHAANGQQIFATLYGFDACRGDYVLHMDSDVLIGRPHPAHDYLADMIGVLEQNPRALFVSPPVPGAAQPYRPAGSDGRLWGVDPRCGLFDRRRLHAARPLPNEVGDDGRWQLAWHRACNRLVAGSDFRAYRGGDPGRAFFLCVPNEEKPQADRFFRVVDRIEQGFYPPRQEGKVELAGGDWEWAGPKRHEPYIFIICGRNVEAGRFRRCFDSLLRQSETDWGAVIVDDASDNGLGDYIGHLIAPHRGRVTFIRNPRRRRTMHNTWDAIANFCGDPHSVIITLDADDALIGRHALARVRREYDAGADATVGSMLRLDKETDYIPDFNDPRGRRGGNVWQHLRTFRKHLFDAINADDLKRDGEWIDPASDWAFMLPIIEMARRPAHIPDLLYLYEPATPGRAASRQESEAVIRHLTARPRYRPADSPRPKHLPDRGR